MRYRKERDFLGVKKVPKDAYYGIFTQRAFENFQISNLKFHPELINALAIIKIAAANTNISLKLLDKRKGIAIIKAAKEIINGKFNKEFILDVYQAGAGTSTHMNVNEVIANRANKILKKNSVHPNDHVNMGQSSNDVFPTAIRLASLEMLNNLLLTLNFLEKSLRKKGNEFKNVLKSGRTHLQDAVPITLGQEFNAYATSIRKNTVRIKQSVEFVSYLGIGGNAVGTGLNTNPSFRKLVVSHIRNITKLGVKPASDTIETTQFMTDFADLSSRLKLLATDLDKIASDLRLMSSGPRTGFNEIILPVVQPGSSMMPGKVNPSILESLNMICYQVMGNDETISKAALAGQLDLNVMTPVIAYNLLHSIEILNNGINNFVKKCLLGIKANKKICKNYFEISTGVVTALVPYIGYAKSAEIVKESIKTDKTIKQLVLKKKLLTEKQLEKILNPKNLSSPNL